jgi:hypothetical protein
MKHGWGLKDAWQRSRQVLMRWVTLLAENEGIYEAYVCHLDYIARLLSGSGVVACAVKTIG